MYWYLYVNPLVAYRSLGKWDPEVLKRSSASETGSLSPFQKGGDGPQTLIGTGVVTLAVENANSFDTGGSEGISRGRCFSPRLQPRSRVTDEVP